MIENRGQRGLETRFFELDDMLNGLQPGEMIIVAARPSMGKAQPLDARVLTRRGWKTMGQLRANADPGDGCRADCTAELCGDCIRDPAEACDDANADPGDGCRADCTAELCGDGLHDPAEACDDGNADPGDGCRADCTAELCGDGVLDPAEACDDGNAAPGDGCDASCQLEVPPLPGGGYASLVDAFDTAVGDGTLVGTGRGRSAEKHLRALRRLLQAAQRWLDDDRKGFGCGALKIALLALDGAPNPPDLAIGPAAPLLAAQIGEAMQEVGCHLPKPRPPRHDRHDHDRP
jgi:cysteine-rich repeat protein